ncbi:hypothetical protein BAE44_0016966 [Dichanthelium oligosanthes]|uniref:F-box domain-containing protein n=1 Tax=Dichanthelium oligosanthes TaxID=888268 RepID=A0A1E5VAG6_9POAL|nr:hypothetical protein BAE44_0016966 [Dichanthelium oligosanthes]
MENAASVPTLPDDVLTAVLGRLPARSLVASRCVCQAWRGLIDDHRLLLRHLLPLSVRGIFVNYVVNARPHFFAHPTSAPAASPRINGRFCYVAPDKYNGDYRVMDHCNGLVLYGRDDYGEVYVCNPMTRRWVDLPLLSLILMRKPRAFLVFNPAVSLHYEVLVGAPLHPEKQTLPPAEE